MDEFDDLFTIEPRQVEPELDETEPAPALTLRRTWPAADAYDIAHLALVIALNHGLGVETAYAVAETAWAAAVAEAHA